MDSASLKAHIIVSGHLEFTFSLIEAWYVNFVPGPKVNKSVFALFV